MTERKAYHRYFEGYSERRVWDEKKNRYHIESYYSGDYYQEMAAEEERKRIKREYVAGYMAAILIFLVTATRKTAGSASAVTAFPTLAVLLGLLWQLPSLVSCLLGKAVLIARQYRERNNFMALNMGLVCCFLASAGAYLLYMCLNRSYGDWQEWFMIAGNLCDSLIFFGIYRREKGRVYIKIQNNNQIPEDCYDITLRED